MPGTLVLEQPDTIRFDLFKESPYSRGADGRQKGRYQIVLRGDDDLAQNHLALADMDGKLLDGEPISPAGGVISGVGGPGGDFSAFLVVGAEPTPTPSLLHVRRIEFLGFQNQMIDAVKRPDETVKLSEHIAAIRFNFDNAFTPNGRQKAECGRPRRPVLQNPQRAAAAAPGLLGDVHAQHALQADRRATAPLAFRIVWQQRRHQGRPRRRGFEIVR